ncbi:MAG: hypothetical protein RRB13_00725 [bacterium]|nr:hypothetical protein [bacterium]
MAKSKGLSHELPITRNWDDALDALHHLLMKKWYYVGIASNTKKGKPGTRLEASVEFSRKRADYSDSFKALLGLSRNHFAELQAKIDKAKWEGGGKADVWHLKNATSQLPKGAAVIELGQKSLGSLLGGGEMARTAWLILDAKCSVSDQNNCMMLLKKVLGDKGYTKTALSAAKTESKQKKAPAQRTKALDLRGARQPGSLVLMLKGDFAQVVPTISPAEKALLLDYFDQLEARGESNAGHKELRERIERALKNQ